MAEGRREPDPTRRLLKMFGIKVTDYEERAQVLLQRQSAARTAEEREAVMREAAELTADLHHWLRETTNLVLQLESDLLMRLVAETNRSPGGSPPNR